MKNVTQKLTGVAIVAFGILILSVSASMSYQGYEREFETLFGAGLIGVAIAGLAFLCAGAIGVARSQGMPGVATIAAIMAVVCFAGDVYGNNLATGGDVHQDALEALQGQAAHDAANTALPITRHRLNAAQSKLETLSGNDTCAVQRLLKSEGLYAGKIDCRNGPLTEAATLSLGVDLRNKITALEQSESDQVRVVSAARPIEPSDFEGKWALIVAFLLTLLGMCSSAIGLPLIVGRETVSVDQAFDRMEDELDTMEQGLGELFDFVSEASRRSAL